MSDEGLSPSGVAVIESGEARSVEVDGVMSPPLRAVRAAAEPTSQEAVDDGTSTAQNAAAPDPSHAPGTAAAAAGHLRVTSIESAAHAPRGEAAHVISVAPAERPPSSHDDDADGDSDGEGDAANERLCVDAGSPVRLNSDDTESSHGDGFTPREGDDAPIDGDTSSDDGAAAANATPSAAVAREASNVGVRKKRSELAAEPSGYFPKSDIHRKSGGSLTVMSEVKEGGIRTFLPSVVNITQGDSVLFRWYDHGQIVLVGNDGHPVLGSRLNSDIEPGAPLPSEHNVKFVIPGRYRFESLRHPGELRAVISVREKSNALRWHVLRDVFLATAVVFVVAATTSALVESSKNRYYVADPPPAQGEPDDDGGGLRLFEDTVKAKTLPWVLSGVLLLVLVAFARLFYCCVPVRLSDFGRGFLEYQQRSLQLASTVVAGAILLALSMSWVSYLKLSFGFATLVGVIMAHVRTLINEAVAVIFDVRFLISTTQASTVPASAFELLSDIEGTSSGIREWTDIGEELVRAGLRIVAASLFVVLHLYLVTSAALLVGVRRRRASTLNSAFWFAIVGTTGVCISIGVNALFADVISRTRETAVGFAESTLSAERAQNLTGAGEDSAFVHFLVSCSSNGTFSTAFVEQRVADTVATWNARAPNELKFPEYDFANSSGIRNLNQYMDLVVAQIDIVERNLAANSTLLGRSLRTEFAADLLPTLQASLRIARAMITLIDCRILRDIFEAIVPVLDESVIGPHNDLMRADFWLLAGVLTAIVVSAVAAHVFDRPYKFWYEPQTDRWFRFRAAYLAHRRLMLRSRMEESGGVDLFATSMLAGLQLSFHRRPSVAAMAASHRRRPSLTADTVEAAGPVGTQAVPISIVESIVVPESPMVPLEASGRSTIHAGNSEASPVRSTAVAVDGELRDPLPWPTADSATPEKAPRWHPPPLCSRASWFSAFYQATLLSGMMLLFEAMLLIALHRSYVHNRLEEPLVAAAACCIVFPVVTYAANVVDDSRARAFGRGLCFALAAVSFGLLVHNADSEFDSAATCTERNRAARNAGNSTALVVVTEGCGLDATLRSTEHGIYSMVVAITCGVALLSSLVLVFFARRRVGDFLVVVVDGTAHAGTVTIAAIRRRLILWRLRAKATSYKQRRASAVHAEDSGELMGVGPADGDDGASAEHSDAEAEEAPRAPDAAKLAASTPAASSASTIDVNNADLTFEEREALREYKRERRNKRLRKGAKWVVAALLFACLLAFIIVATLPQAQNDSGTKPDTVQSSSGVGCNGGTANCGLRIDQMVWLTTHNSFSALEDEFIGPNQYFGMRRQLNDGVRAFMIDIYNLTDPVTNATRPALCHGDCRIGFVWLDDTLTMVNEFLDANPTDVVVFLVEQYARDASIAAALAMTGLERKAWVANSSATTAGASFRWPTLDALTRSGKQVLWFTDRRGGGTVAGATFDRPREAPWMLFMWDYFFETPFSVNATSRFGCERAVRGNATASFDGRLAILNHFLTDLVGAPYLAVEANAASVISRHFFGCLGQWASLPQFLAVDFYTIADTLAQAADLGKRARA